MGGSNRIGRVRVRTRGLAVVLVVVSLFAPGVVLASSATAMDPPPPPPDLTKGTIAGSFTGGVASDGVAIVRDSLYSPGLYDWIQLVEVGTAGSYQMTNLDPGSYHVAFAAGWVPGGPVAGAAGAPYGVVTDVVVTANATTIVDFAKGTTQSISGVVTGPGGTPVAGATVCTSPDLVFFLRIPGPGCGSTPGSPVTDGAGAFTISGLPIGPTRVSAGDSSGELNAGVKAEGGVVHVVSAGPTTAIDVRLGERFADVPNAHGFFVEINWMSWSEVAGGFADGTFRPTNVVSRQAMASFLYNYEGAPAITLSEPFFADVPSDHPFYGAIQWMAESGLSTGSVNPVEGKPLFKPTDSVSRQAMASFLWRNAGEPTSTLPSAFFDDVAAGGQFFAAVQWMAESGLSTGTPNPPGKPRYKLVNPVTRQAVSAFLYRYDRL